MGNEEDEAITILVTPVWKDSARLSVFGRELAEELAKRGSKIRWIIADDGSGEVEVERLGLLCAPLGRSITSAYSTLSCTNK